MPCHLTSHAFSNPPLTFGVPRSTAPAERFRVEVLFSPGANYNPFEVLPPHHSSHVLPTIPRTALHKGEGITLAEMEEKLLPFSQVGPGGGGTGVGRAASRGGDG